METVSQLHWIGESLYIRFHWRLDVHVTRLQAQPIGDVIGAVVLATKPLRHYMLNVIMASS